MSTRRAGKKDTTPAKPTTYEVSVLIEKKDAAGDAIPGATAWQPQGEISTTSGGAPAAIRKWAESQGETFAGGRLRAVPTSNITERQVDVETKRQLTLGAP